MRCVLYRCKRCFAEWAERRPDDGAVEDSKCRQITGTRLRGKKREPIECGGEAPWVRIRAGDFPEPTNPVPHAFVKGKPYEFDPRFAVASQHASRGVSAEAYKRETRAQQRREINRQKEIDKMPCKGKDAVPKFLGSMSMEMAASIGLQEGDPNVLLKDPEHFLKATGRHTGA